MYDITLPDKPFLYNISSHQQEFSDDYLSLAKERNMKKHRQTCEKNRVNRKKRKRSKNNFLCQKKIK